MIHFQDRSKNYYEKIGTLGGESNYRYPSICGFKHRETTEDIEKITCLLCLRGIIHRVLKIAPQYNRINKNLMTPNLFERVSREHKKRRQQK